MKYYSPKISSSVVLKRIQRDYLEIKNCPVKGIGIQQFDNDPFAYIINIKILTGCYDGLILQLHLYVPENYPIDPPKACILKGQGFCNDFHHHVFPERLGGGGDLGFCFNLLENRFGMDTKEIGTGWTSAYTLKAICLQLQNFLANPDIPIPSKEKINQLFKKNMQFVHEYTINNQKIVHSFDNPFPEIYGFEEKTDPKQVLKLQLQEKLTCYFTKTNPLVDSHLTIGYPIDIRLDFKKRIEPFPIPEIVSYTGYTAEGSENKNVMNVMLKTAYGQKYNFWIPIYVNKEHYDLSENIIYKSISILKCKDVNKTEKDFKKEYIIEVFPALLCKMIVFLLDGSKHSSIAAMEAFCHFILLFQKMIDEHGIQEYINEMIESVKNAKMYDLRKASLPDIGNFIVLLFFSRFRDLKDKRLFHKILREYLARQIYWIFIADEKYKNPESKTESNRTKLMRYFIDDPNIFKKYELIITKNTKQSRGDLNYYENELMKHEKFFENLFFKNEKNKFKNFQYFSFMKEILKQNLNFDSKEDKITFDNVRFRYLKYTDLKENIFSVEKDDFNEFIRNKDYPVTLLEMSTDITRKNIMREIFKFALVSNQLLIFTFLASKTFITPEFIEKLENNFGVIELEDAENFIAEIEKLKRNIDTYDKMFEFLGMNEMIKEDVCEHFFRSCAHSNLQNYTSLNLSQDFIYKYR